MKTAIFLGIETSGTDTGVALAGPDHVIFEAVNHGGNHNEVLLGLIDEAFKSSGIGLKTLGGIGVTIGPGMFTSLRVGLSVAEGIAIAHAIPVKGISTLFALAQAAKEPGKPVLAVIDARKHQVYAGLYKDEQVLIKPRVIYPEGLAELAGRFIDSGTVLVLAGNGTRCCVPFLSGQERVQVTGIQAPPPHIVAQIAARLIPAGGNDIGRLAPLYLRRTDAELKRERTGD